MIYRITGSSIKYQTVAKKLLIVLEMAYKAKHYPI